MDTLVRLSDGGMLVIPGRVVELTADEISFVEMAIEEQDDFGRVWGEEYDALAYKLKGTSLAPKPVRSGFWRRIVGWRFPKINFQVKALSKELET